MGPQKPFFFLPLLEQHIILCYFLHYVESPAKASDAVSFLFPSCLLRIYPLLPTPPRFYSSYLRTYLGHWERIDD